MAILGLDIGGANLKAADGREFAASQPFALWREPENLANALAELIVHSFPGSVWERDALRLCLVCPSASPGVRGGASGAVRSQAEPGNEAKIAVTMTGELADCYANKAEGVSAILAAVKQVAGDRPVGVYLCDGRIVNCDEAVASPLLAAASNWHALARFMAKSFPSAGLLVDIGSTTADIIPLVGGGPRTFGKTDPERLAAGELVYSGVGRTPVCAVVDRLPWRKSECPVAAELFATTADAYLQLELTAEEPNNCDTADGRPRTREMAWTRLARMICADATMFSFDDACHAAESICAAQLERLASAARRVLARQPSPPECVVVSGQGEFLARRLMEKLSLNAEVISASEQLGPAVSTAACAHAVAVLAAEEWR